ADRVDALDIGLHHAADLDETALIHLDAQLLQADAFVVLRLPANTHQHAFGRELLLVAIGAGHAGHHLRIAALDRLEAGVGHDLDAALGERLVQLGANLLVLNWDNPRQRLDDGDLAAERAIGRGELDPDRAGADH